MSFILLTASTEAYSSTSIVGFLVGLMIICFGGVMIYKKYKSTPNGNQELEKFLSEIQSVIKVRIIEFIEKIDFTTIKEDFSNMQATLINDLYDDIWKLVEEELDKIYGKDNLIYVAIKKVLTKEKIMDYVNIIFAEEEIQDKLADLYNTALDEKNSEIEKEDKKLSEEAKKYEEDCGGDDGEPVKELDPTKLPGVEEEIIPPSEEESDIVSADTVEIIDTTDVSEDI